MKITQANYFKLKRLMIDELINDVNSVYQLGIDEMGRVKLHDDFHQLILTLGCFDDNEAIHDVLKARRILNQFNNDDSEDQIESCLDRANLD